MNGVERNALTVQPTIRCRPGASHRPPRPVTISNKAIGSPNSSVSSPATATIWKVSQAALSNSSTSASNVSCNMAKDLDINGVGERA